ncbi:hypothetical protein ANN_21053 [Periplaneta americana]|uniref:Reverse transcriptase n=1 Tax=Periplaneta americana TaxID=6978 RepID=A0ABQ8SEB7_PERAM|nr:hypothetical protein ANN_21053 [Periplaneta americana]
MAGNKALTDANLEKGPLNNLSSMQHRFDVTQTNIQVERDGIKMVGNVAAVRAVPERSQHNRCRHCHNEVETLAHVLGSCPHGEALRNATHHQVRSIIATALKDADYNNIEEVHGLSVTASTRRIDIIAFKESTRSGFIIDPTVRFKTNEEQPAEVDKEKNNIYNPTIPYYLRKYQLEELEVIGLLNVFGNKLPVITVYDIQPCDALNIHQEAEVIDRNQSIKDVGLQHCSVYHDTPWTLSNPTGRNLMG